MTDKLSGRRRRGCAVGRPNKARLASPPDLQRVGPTALRMTTHVIRFRDTVEAERCGLPPLNRGH